MLNFFVTGEAQVDSNEYVQEVKDLANLLGILLDISTVLPDSIQVKSEPDINAILEDTEEDINVKITSSNIHHTSRSIRMEKNSYAFT